MKGPDGKSYHVVEKGAYKAIYDRWGRLHRLEYDSNGDGKPDHIARHDGRKTPHEIAVDADFDGRAERWERYDETGRLLKIGTSSRGAASADVWAVLGPGDEITAREYDADGDGRPERVERLNRGVLARVEIDADRDGRADRWLGFRNGRIATEDLDTDADGRPDRRLRYDASGGVASLDGPPAASR